VAQFSNQQSQKLFAIGHQQPSLCQWPCRSFIMGFWKTLSIVLLLTFCLLITGQGVAHAASQAATRANVANRPMSVYIIKPTVILRRYDGTEVHLEAVVNFTTSGGKITSGPIYSVNIWQNGVYEGLYALPTYYGPEIYIYSDSNNNDWVDTSPNWSSEG
jgi:sulfur transfer complex TusBCD TusB component (DsrH family)